MLKDELWKARGFGKRDLLCTDCFERDLGRMINRDDLENCIMTRVIVKFADRAVAGIF